MKIGLIHGSSQKDKNEVLYEILQRIAKGHEIVNFGCFPNEEGNYSYLDVALQIFFLINTHIVDFVITGCSSGQGMMLACNSFPGIFCGYCNSPQDAFLFGRINNGNVMSLPLGLNYGWCGEINIEYIISGLFKGEFGIGYPAKDAEKKVRDTETLKRLNLISKIDGLMLLDKLDSSILVKLFQRTDFIKYILLNGKNKQIQDWLIERGKIYGYSND